MIVPALAPETQKLIRRSREIARRRRSEALFSEHLALGMIAIPDIACCQALFEFQINLDALQRELLSYSRWWEYLPEVHRVERSPRVRWLLNHAQKEALYQRSQVVQPHDIFVSIILDPSALAGNVLREMNSELNYRNIRDYFASRS